MMTSIWYEILPVTLEADQAVVLRRREDGAAHPWQVLHQAARHPSATVLEHVARCFGTLFEPDESIVHSTSWRYCAHSERLILTYLVVLPQRTWRSCRQAKNFLVALPVGEVEQARGDHLQPPEHMDMDHILAHALDHLALLQSCDASINAVLEIGWSRVLERRLPRPAGYVTPTARE
jgi:hypothetical protein